MTTKLDKTKSKAAKKVARQPPQLGLELDESVGLKVSIEGDYDALRNVARNTNLIEGLVGQIAKLGSPGQIIDEEASNFALGFIDSMNPRDTAEALLLAQMAVVHQATMVMARRLNHTNNILQQDSAERALNKLGRTFVAQMEALKRYRSKVQQTVRVERVTVQEGGQAIVGNVAKGGEYDEK